MVKWSKLAPLARHGVWKIKHQKAKASSIQTNKIESEMQMKFIREMNSETEDLPFR